MKVQTIQSTRVYWEPNMHNALLLSMGTVEVDVKHALPLEPHDDAAALALGRVVGHKRTWSRDVWAAPHSVEAHKPFLAIEDLPNGLEGSLPGTVEDDGPSLRVPPRAPVHVAPAPPEALEVLLGDWAGKTSSHRSSRPPGTPPKRPFDLHQNRLAHKRALRGGRWDFSLASRFVLFLLFACIINAANQFVDLDRGYPVAVLSPGPFRSPDLI